MSGLSSRCQDNRSSLINSQSCRRWRIPQHVTPAWHQILSPADENRCTRDEETVLGYPKRYHRDQKRPWMYRQMRRPAAKRALLRSTITKSGKALARILK